MIKAIIFDFDGTIINTNELIREGLQYFSYRYNKRRLSPKEINDLFGRPLEEQMAYIDSQNVELLTAQFKIWYQHHHNAKAFAFPGVVQTIKTLSARGIPLAILTNNSTGTVLSGLDHLGIRQYFDHMISRDDVKETKPSPEGMHKLLNKMALQPHEVVFVGDTANDILAGQNAGVKSALVGWSVTPVAHPSDFVLDKAEDLIHLIELGEMDIA